ncbi:MAG: GDP-mannose 4,6-dehydratase [Verrucomicrobia bacterium]|nr:GDP-mannose 4,6-dehydratase [Verrucomicrobiota bacterium]
MKDSEVAKSYAGRNVLITGGLGMIGSNIALQLVEFGARVTILDVMAPSYGGNYFNIREIQDKVTINIADIRDRTALSVLLRDKEIVFNLAAQVSHNDSLSDPFLDAEINYLGHLNVLESARLHNPEALIVHAGSRLQYGRIEQTPVREDHPLNPLTPYALNKTSAENMYRFYHRVHGVPSVLFRIANPYGPRSQMRHSKYSIVNWFIRQAMDDQEIEIYGDGRQLRDYIYVDDLARALILGAVTPACVGEVFNVGSGVGTSFKEMVENVVKVVGKGVVKFRDWPEDYINVETGDYISDITKLKSCIDWSADTSLEEGVGKTVEYYTSCRNEYW